MADYSKQLLSGSASGQPIVVAATATPGTLIHTAIAGATAKDLIYLEVSNVTGSAATLSIEWGGVADPGNLIAKQISVPANSGPTLIVAGSPLNGGLVVRAFSGTASALNITGWVDRIQ